MSAASSSGGPPVAGVGGSQPGRWIAEHTNCPGGLSESTVQGTVDHWDSIADPGGQPTGIEGEWDISELINLFGE
jgi:hypothetical protein